MAINTKSRIIDATIKTNEGSVLLSASVGRQVQPLPHKEAWEQFSEIVTGDSDPLPPVIYLGNKGYLPKVYNDDNGPQICWALGYYPVDGVTEHDNVISTSYVLGNTSGYQSPHLKVIFELKEGSNAGTVNQILIPVSVKYDPNGVINHRKMFMDNVEVYPETAFHDHVNKVDKTAGLEYLDTTGEYTKDNGVLPDDDIWVIDLVTKQTPQYETKSRTFAVVEYKGKFYKVRCTMDVNTMAEMGLTFPEPVRGYVRLGKTYLNLYALDLSEENIIPF